MFTIRKFVFLLLIPLLPLTGCGGGGGESSNPVSPSVDINISPGTTITTDEYGLSTTISISLGSIPSDNVTIPISSLDTTEGTVDKTSLIFTKTDWSTPQTITVTGVNDTIADGDQNYYIQVGPAIAAPSSTYNSMVKFISAVNRDVVDGSFIISAISGSTSESGTSAQFTVRLGSAPIADVTIPVESSNTAEGTINKSSLLFTTADWDLDQTVIVTGVSDTASGDQAYDIQLGPVSSTDPKYNGLDPADVSVTNLNFKKGALIVSPSSSYTDESGKTATFTVHLNIAPAASVTIPVNSSVTTEGTVSTVPLVFTSGNYSADQTVTVTGVDDNIADGNQSYSITLGPTTSTDDNFNGLNSTVSMTNVDLVDPYGVTPRISAGNYHNLVLAGDGTVWGWGKCSASQLDAVETTCPGVSGQTFPQRLNITKAAAVSAGTDFSAIVKADGTVWTSGVNDNNQLGHTGAGAGSPLAQVDVLTGTRTVSAGENHTLALKNDGTVWAWGYGYSGQLGDSVVYAAIATPGSPSGSQTPVQATFPGGTTITAIAAGDSHSLALAGGEVYSWGADAYSQLGQGTTNQSVSTPQKITGLSNVTAIGTGKEYSFAVGIYSTVSGTYAWGSNNDFQLGTSTGDKAVPTAVSVLSTTVNRIDGGFQHSLALVDTTVYAWGDNDNTDGSESWNNSGALGKANTTDLTVPTTTFATFSATDVSAGDNYSLVLLSDGRIYSSGVNNYSQLGTNLIATSTYTASPVAVEDPADNASFYAYRPILSGQPATSSPSTSAMINVCKPYVGQPTDYCKNITYYKYKTDSTDSNGITTSSAWSGAFEIATAPQINLTSATLIPGTTISLLVKGMTSNTTEIQTETSAVKASWYVTP